jgi:hypothetical protein
LWYLRSVRFWDALLAGDWAGTYQQYHPGVTTMWLSGLALKLFAWRHGVTSEQLLRVAPAKPGTFDAAAAAGVLPIAFVVALCIVLAYVLLKRLTDRWTAFVSSFLLAFDPFLIAYSKQIHLNALLSAFMLTSVLFLFDHLAHERRPSLIWSGVFAGLSLLTKSPALFLLPFAVLVLGVTRLKESASSRAVFSGRRRDWVRFLVWGGTAAAVFCLLWPAMWVESVGVLHQIGEQALFHVRTSHENPVFFGSRVTTGDPGILFYLATIGWKTTLVTLPMACLALLFALFGPRRSPFNWIAWLLAAYAVFLTVQMALGSWKQVSYMMPVVAALDVLAALGLVQGAGVLDRVRWPKRARLGGAVPWLKEVLIVLVLVLQAGVAISRHPYYGTHHNALLGGSQVAQHVLPLQDQGEGLDLAARYLNAQPRAQYSGAYIHARSSLAFERKYEGLTTNVPDPRATYRVYYVNQVMRGLGGAEWEAAWEVDRRAPPLWSVSFDGIPYVWVYGTPPEEPAAGGPQHIVDYRLGEHIRLVGFRLSAERVSPGEMLTVVLLWQSDGLVKENYTVFCHVSSGSGLVAQHDGRPVLEIRPVPSWRAGEILHDHHPLALGADLVPGEYELSVGMYDLKTLERVPAYDSVGERLPQDRIVLGAIDVQ